MAAEYSEASDSLIHAAERIIRQYHADLADARIGFLFRSETSASQGKIVVAKAQKVTSVQNGLIEAQGGEALDFLIWVAKDAWLAFTPGQQDAMLDHELCHCSYEGGVARLRAHDVEEFNEIIERYGFWHESLQATKKVFQKSLQLNFDDLAPGHPRGAVVAAQPELMQV